MQSDAPKTPASRQGSRLGLWIAMGLLALLLILFLFGRYTDFLNLDALQRAIAEFADGPWGCRQSS